MAGYFDGGKKDELVPNVQRSPSFFGEGGVGRNIAGFMGDYLSQLGGGQPIYAPIMAQKMRQAQEMEEYQRRLADELRMWQTKEKWKQENDPYVPTSAKDAAYYRKSGQPDVAADIEAKERLIYVQQADPTTGEVRFVGVRPSSLFGDSGGGDVPVVGSAAEAAKLPPGSKFRPYPGGPIKQVPGGASPSNGSGGFPGPY